MVEPKDQLHPLVEEFLSLLRGGSDGVMVPAITLHQDGRFRRSGCMLVLRENKTRAQQQKQSFFHTPSNGIDSISSTSTRSNSATLHAWAMQPRGWWGGSPSKISEICPSPAVFTWLRNGSIHCAACCFAAAVRPCTVKYAV